MCYPPFVLFLDEIPYDDLSPDNPAEKLWSKLYKYPSELDRNENGIVLE